MRCFIDATGKLFFCLLVSTGTSDLLQRSLPGTGRVSVFHCLSTRQQDHRVFFFVFVFLLPQTEGHFLKAGHPSQAPSMGANRRDGEAKS